MAEQAPPPNMQEPPSARPVHGGVKPAELRALGLKPEEVLDFSASVSPIGPPTGVWEALRQVDLAAYPDPQSLELREALSRHLTHPQRRPEGIPVGQILVGNGSTEIIHLLTRAFLSPLQGGKANCALLLTPTYGEYAGACRLAGASVSCVEAMRCPPFGWDLSGARRRIAQERPGLVFLCNPNNPTGVYLNGQEVQILVEAVAGAGGLLVIDEAYASFVDNPWDSVDLAQQGNVVLVRSMTKDYALTALRLGYALAAEDLIAQLAALQPDWSVNSMAQAAGLAALADTGYLPKAKMAVDQAKEYLTGRISGLGLTVHPSTANFLLVDVADGALWRERLMRRGLFVRDCASFGLPQCIRIGIRSLADCQRLVEAMEVG